MSRSFQLRPASSVLRLTLSAALALLTFGMVAVASAQPKATDWRATDVKGRGVATEDYRGKVLMVFIASDETKDLMQPITEELVVRYGTNPKVAQLTLADFSDAPFTWKSAEKISGTVTEKTAKAHDRTVVRIQNLLKKNGKAPIPGLDRKLHIVIDWDQKLVKRYKHWDAKKYVTVAVINPQGDVIGTWKLGPGKGSLQDQLVPVYEAIDATAE